MDEKLSYECFLGSHNILEYRVVYLLAGLSLSINVISSMSVRYRVVNINIHGPLGGSGHPPRMLRPQTFEGAVSNMDALNYA